LINITFDIILMSLFSSQREQKLISQQD